MKQGCEKDVMSRKLIRTHQSILSFFLLFMALVMVLAFSGVSHAVSGYATQFQNAYPNSPLSKLSTVPGQANNLCTVCHGPSGGSRNPFGSDFANAAYGNHNFNTTLDARDSDGDGPSNRAEIDAGYRPGDGTSTPPPPTTACTGYTYSAWSTCGSNGQQTRTVTGNTPAGCTGTPTTQPVLTQSCTPPTTACTGYTYSAWSTCGSNGQQTRTVTGNTPAGCTGTPTTQPVLTQSCTPPIAGDTTSPVVTAFNIQAVSNSSKIAISEFTATDNVGVTGYMVKRNATPPTAQDAGWQGVPPTSIRIGGQGVKTVYAWAKDAAGNISEPARSTVVVARKNKKRDAVIRAPKSQEVFSYNAVAYPVERENLAKAKPLGIGKGGDILDLQASIGPFDEPVDVYITLLEPAYAGSPQSATRYNLRSDNIFVAAASASQAWQTNVTDINEHITDISVADLLSGPYILLMTVTPTGSQDTYYQWVTPFVIR